jgi:hypothetical protein
MATTVDQKLLKATKFPPEFNQKVDMQKVNLEVMRKYAVLSHYPSRLDKLTSPRSDGLQARFQIFLEMKMMWL